ISRHDRLQHRLPPVGAVNVARTQGAAFQIAKLVEHEQRMIAGAVVVAVPASKIPLGGRRSCTRSIHWPERSARVDRFFSAASHLVSKRPIWLGDAAQSAAALP